MALPTELHALCQEFDRERPKVLVVVGAGISFGATGEKRSSWSGLLEHGVETLRTKSIWNDETANANLTLIRNAFSTSFDLDEVLSRAESVSKALGAPDGPDYGSWLTDAIGTLKAREGRTAALNAIKQLEQAGALILTTNYDSLLSDATGLDPVTWQDHGEFLRVLNREREGILHIHGHWRHPSSVVLGRKSYETIVAAPALQDLFKSIWLHWSWLYVGCGNGLDDPNVGRLLRWGHESFGGLAPRHFFFAKEQDAANLSRRPDKPANLVPVGYRDHAELPDQLQALTPRHRPWPFVELGATCGPVRHPSTSPLDIPLPSWQELLNGDVPAMAADVTVSAALRTHGWALVYDVASVGKTTLALRLAAGPEYRDAPAFYLDLAQIGASDDVETAAISAAVRRLAHGKALIILDNVHWAPQVIQAVWRWWSDHPRTSHLLMMATRIQYTGGISGDDALTVIENHSSNPAITVKPMVYDLLPIVNYIVKRISGRSMGLQPPEEAIAKWHATFGSQMGAFAAAVTGCHLDFMRGHWDLPRSAAADWIYSRHLHSLNENARENLVCLSSFATLELEVDELALPHANQISILLRKGLVERRERGQERLRFYALREPDWGALLLGAISPQPVVEEVLLGTACRHITMALNLDSRLPRESAGAFLAKLWQRLSEPGMATKIGDQLSLRPLAETLRFQTLAAKSGRKELVDGLLEAWLVDPERLAVRAFEAPLADLAAFIDTASSHQSSALLDRLLRVLEAAPNRVAARAFEAPLDHLAAFIDRASAQPQSTLLENLWHALESAPARLASRVLEAPLDHLAAFIDRASARPSSTLLVNLWQELEKDPDRLATRAFEAPLDHLAAFIDRASAQPRSPLLVNLWQELEKSPDRLAARAFEAPLDHLAAFIDRASAQPRSTLHIKLWQELEKNPDRLAARAFDAPIKDIATFMRRASAQQRTTLLAKLWQELEKHPDRLAKRALEAPLKDLAGFIDRASAQQPPTLLDKLWQELERSADRVATRASEAPLADLAAFIHRASSHERSGLLEKLWRALAEDPTRLAERAFEAPLSHIATLIGRVPNAIGRLVVAKITPETLFSNRRSPTTAFWFAPRLAARFATIGRSDLADALASHLLTRADSSWFNARNGSLYEVASLLNYVAATDTRQIQAFVDRIGGQTWLARHCRRTTKDAVVAEALVLIALSQPVNILVQFRSPALTPRIGSALAGLSGAEGEALSGHVQLLGAAQLIGRRLPRPPFAAARLDRIARLPLDELPHRPEVGGIEPTQRNLWLGLRVVASLSTARLKVDNSLINDTLRRWRVNQGDSAADPSSSLNRLSQSMIDWLQACVRDGRGVLLPSREPLWLITGALP